MEVEEELHYEGEFPAGQDGTEAQMQSAAPADAEEAENGTEDAPAGGLSGANSRGPSPPRSPEGNGEGLNFGGRSGSGERLMEEEEQQKQESSRAGGRPDVHGVGGGPGGRRTQHRVLISNLDASVQWQDLKDFGRKVGEVNYANVTFSGNKKYGVLEYCEEESMEAAIRELDGTRLRSSHVVIKRDRGDFEALISSGPPRWVAEGGLRGARPPPRGPMNPPRGHPQPRWNQGPLLASPDMRVRERPPPEMVAEPLRGPDYGTRSGGGPPPASRGGRGGGGPPLLLRPGEGLHHPLRGGSGERHHQPYGGALPASRNSRATPMGEDLFGPRRVHSPGRGRVTEPSRGPRRSRSHSPSWRAPPVHAGYRELTGKEGLTGGRIAIYEPPTAWRPPPREGSRRDYSRRDGGAPYTNGGTGDVMGAEGPSYKHSSFHGGPLREGERASPPLPLPYPRGAPPPAAEPLPSSGPSRGGWDRGSRRPPSPRRARPPPPQFSGGGASSRGYGGEGRSRSRSRSWDRRPYSETKGRRGSPPAGMLLMFGSAPSAGPADADWRSRASGTEGPLPNDGGPLPADTRRRQRSRSPRGGREGPYPAAPPHLLQEGRHLATAPTLPGGLVSPQGGPPRPPRDRREDMPTRSGGPGGPSHHQEAFTPWGGNRREESWGERGPPPPEMAQPHFGGASHRRGDSPPMRRRHMGAPEGASSETRYVGSFGDLRGRGDPPPQVLLPGGPPAAHLPRGGAGATEERRGGGGWSYRPSGGDGNAGPPPQFRGGPVSRREGPPPPLNRGPPGQREPFGQLPYRA